MRRDFSSKRQRMIEQQEELVGKGVYRLSKDSNLCQLQYFFSYLQLGACFLDLRVWFDQAVGNDKTCLDHMYVSNV